MQCFLECLIQNIYLFIYLLLLTPLNSIKIKLCIWHHNNKNFYCLSLQNAAEHILSLDISDEYVIAVRVFLCNLFWHINFLMGIFNWVNLFTKQILNKLKVYSQTVMTKLQCRKCYSDNNSGILRVIWDCGLFTQQSSWRINNPSPQCIFASLQNK